MISALRGQLAEGGLIAGKGTKHIGQFGERPDKDDLPELVRQIGEHYLNQLAQIEAEISRLDARIAFTKRIDVDRTCCVVVIADPY
ncbi:hypothetical protein [Phaeovulum sp. NW3]|uniref:hypothetical protein n=1 Tax=Phaeovulum sp. NW3 TaxID=2934933 RepID=UPI002021F498|nr:hypothetical protein [Phaeovulum sp. NW3]MCL7465338.1 hypothetical protein [Phaeovulum sp. NW3]